MHLAASLTLTLIVPVQNYITAIIIFLIVEQLMTWGFYGQFTQPYTPVHNANPIQITRTVTALTLEQRHSWSSSLSSTQAETLFPSFSSSSSAWATAS